MQNLLLVLTVQAALLGSIHSSAVLTTLDVTSQYHSNVVRMICSGGSSGSNVSFHNMVGQTVRRVRSLNGPSTEITIEVGPGFEGEYYCMVDGEKSSSVIVVAYPFSDPTRKRSYTARLGDRVVMNCTIPVGVLRDRYTVQWYKGHIEVNSSSEEFQHISMNDDSGALVFSRAKVSDGSKGYFCKVTVRRNSGDVPRQGATIALHVLAPLRMASTLSSKAGRVGAEVSFTCEASGIPVPEFRWLLNGQQYTNGGITTTHEVREDTVDVRSTFVFSSLVEEHTGTVTCVAFHENNSNTVLVTSSANIVVLTNNFRVDLTFQDGQVVVRGTLPVVISGFFSLGVRFYSTEKVTRVENIVISDVSLADTDDINIVIPMEKLPSFRSFSVAVAIKSNDQYGLFTERTESIDLRDSSLGPCDCSGAAAAGNNGIVVPVISVLVVLMIVGVIILLAICGIIYYNKKSAQQKTSSQYCSHGSFRSSMHRSASHSSQGSQGSRKSSRSRTYCSESGASDCSGQSVELKVVTKEVVAKEELRDVRHFETMDHKMLKQWEEIPTMELNAHHGRNRLGGSYENVGQPATIVADSCLDHEFPQTHIGIPNPLNAPRQGFKESDSSFVDLTKDYLEM